MKRFLLLLPLLLAAPTSAQVDPAIHKLCRDVKDYAGCVNANKINRPEVSIWTSRLNAEDKSVLQRYSKQQGVKIRLVQAKGEAIVQRLKQKKTPQLIF